MRINKGYQQTQRGIGLIEVLIALIVISLGTLISARMQISGLQNAQDTHYQSQATFIISEMKDRMRNNPEGLAAGDYANMNTNSASDPACTNNCTSLQQAQLDLFAWSEHFKPTNNNVEPTLPNALDGTPAAGSITVDASGQHLLKVTWSDFSIDSTTARSVQSTFIP